MNAAPDAVPGAASDGAEVVMAGFGGQGMLLAGKVLAQAAMNAGLEVSWLPSYGPEMRGGTANVTVCLAPTPIGSPLVDSPRALLVMNLPSLEKFAPTVRPGGVIVINTSLVSRDPARDDCVVVKVPARELAEGAGTHKASNFVMLGAYVGASGVLPPEAVERAIESEFSDDRAKFVPVNLAAFRAGVARGRDART
jgi:2-oxoglutarate ferredoxin oxidoreductase subunit gamma